MVSLSENQTYFQMNVELSSERQQVYGLRIKIIFSGDSRRSDFFLCLRTVSKIFKLLL